MSAAVEMKARNRTNEIVEFVADGAIVPSEDVLDNVRKCLLDFIGNAAFAAQYSESSPSFVSGVRSLCKMGVEPGADGKLPKLLTVIGIDEKFPLQYAALLNGAFAHSLDFDDTSLFGSLHPSAVVIPPVLAIAEQNNVRFADFVEAVAVGIEVGCRVGAAIGTTAYDRGFHITPVAGIFGAVAGVARLKGLAADEIASAFALAGSQASGSMQYLSNGAWNKRLHPGFAAHDAVLALAFASSGVLGADDAIDGQYGVLANFSNSPQPSQLTVKLGSWWAAGEVAIKPYPSCRLTHGAIEAALEYRAARGKSETPIGDLTLKLSPKGHQIVGVRTRNKVKPSNIVDGQFSAYFHTAAALQIGRTDWASYELIGDEAVNALADKIHVEIDESLPPAGAEIFERSAPDRSVRVEVPTGEPSRPTTWERMQSKFMGLAEPVWGKEAATSIAQFVTASPSGARVADMLSLMLEGK